MKSNDDVIKDFNEYVNMTADELEKWLKSGDSQSAGWPKGDEGGESVGHDSGRKIVEILRANPKKEAKKYTEDQISHMRKVASYCARHLAQEEKGNNEKSPEEVKKTKSYASLKNWGHDPLKKRSGGKTDSSAAKSTPKNKQANGKKDDQDEEMEDVEDEEPKEKEADKKTGDKRKASDKQEGKNKKQETEKPETEKRATRSSNRNKPEEKSEAPKETEKKAAAKKDAPRKEDPKKADANKEEPKKADAKKEEPKKADAKKQDDAKKADAKKEDDKKAAEKKDDDKKEKSGGGGKATKGPKPGDKVSWNWGGGQPEGKVLDVVPDEAEITTKRGNKVTRKGKPDDPAVVLDTGKSKAIKSNHELN